MVTGKSLACCAGLALLVACGPGLRDGNYPGEPRFVLQGTLQGVASADAPLRTLRISVLWQMVAMPHPASAPQNTGAAAPATNAAGGTSNPNAVSQPPAGPQPVNQADGNGQDNAAVQVAFPAPVSLDLYDFPETEPDWPARQAEGTVVVFYDLDGNGRYDASTETIASTLQDFRILYVRTPQQSSLYFVNSLLDNSAAFAGPMALAQRRCDGAAEHLQVVPNQAVSLAPGAPVPCSN